MTPAACTTAVLAVLLAGSSTAEAQSRDYKGQSLDLLRLLADKPWMGLGPHNRWDRPPHIESELANGYDPRIHPHINLDSQPHAMDSDEDNSNYVDDDLRLNSEKRSAVATALNSGRRRRQPTPALGVLNDVGSFFDSLRDNLEALASLSPQQRSNLFQDPPNVVHAPSSNRSWRRTGLIPGRTTTIRACCGPAWGGRRAGRTPSRLIASDQSHHYAKRPTQHFEPEAGVRPPQVNIRNADLKKYISIYDVESLPHLMLALQEFC
ncbi:uncharacterized protein LOC135078128 isoform X2 [Ostrinia nubilalis]|uniref:uncharacterized protein LOC135078128 isoform X2 n=1 Tax=Ostrinia nubilalis TaxID=29057 RepID=UPI0030826BAF